MNFNIATNILWYHPSCSVKSHHSLARASFPSTALLASSTRLQATSPYGLIATPYSCARSLLACLTAYLAAMPCMMIAPLKTLNESPHAISALLNEKPATSAYQASACALVGRPGVAPGRKAGFEAEEVVKPGMRRARGLVAVV